MYFAQSITGCLYLCIVIYVTQSTTGCLYLCEVMYFAQSTTGCLYLREVMYFAQSITGCLYLREVCILHNQLLFVSIYVIWLFVSRHICWDYLCFSKKYTQLISSWLCVCTEDYIFQSTSHGLPLTSDLLLYIPKDGCVPHATLTTYGNNDTQCWYTLWDIFINALLFKKNTCTSR